MASQLQAEEVRRVFGEILDWKVRAILASGATPADLEIVRMWLDGDEDLMGEAHPPLAGAAAVVYDLVASAEDFLGDDAEASPTRV